MCVSFSAHSTEDILDGDMAESNSLSLFCTHPVFFPRGNYFYQFLARRSRLIFSIYERVCVVGRGAGDILNTYCSVPGFCCFTAYLGDLSVSLPTELPHCFERLPHSSL